MSHNRFQSPCCLHKCISFVFCSFIWPFNVERIIQWYGLAGRNDEQKKTLHEFCAESLNALIANGKTEQNAVCGFRFLLLIQIVHVHSRHHQSIRIVCLNSVGGCVPSIVSLGVHVCDSSVVLPINSITRILPQSGYCELVNCKHISTKWVCIGFLLLLDLSCSQSKNFAYLRRRNI